MKTEKRVLSIHVDMDPLSIPGARVNFYCQDAENLIPVCQGKIRKTFQVTVDVPVIYDQIPPGEVVEITSSNTVVRDADALGPDTRGEQHPRSL